jgi:predicted DNA-binding WGR domain protein
MTEGKQMQTKWCLVKVSDGTRGALGKKKVYELSIDGNSFTAVWGMAEKPARQHQVKSFTSAQGARWAAMDKLQSKLDKGYVIAYSA